MRIAQVRALIVVGVLLLIAGTTSWYAIANDSQTAAGQGDCQPGDVDVDITLPQESEVQVDVENATDTPGLADTAGEALKEYGFKVQDTGDNKQDLKNPVEIHYGPKAVAGGHLLRAYFSGEKFFFDINNKDDGVKVILGEGFMQVNTESDARLALPEIGRPEAPEGTCAVG